MAQPNAALMKAGANTKLGPNANAALKKYVDKSCQAVCSAIGMWQMQAMFSGIRINGPVAIGAPGCLKGPNIESLVKASSPVGTDWERKMSQAIASAVGSAWSNYERSVTIPGLPWYPQFAAYPGPMAPPMPNTPTPFINLPQTAPASIQSSVQSGIKMKAGSLASAAVVADAIAAGLGMMLPVWVAGVIIRNVLGKGPVPSFAPPYVPVGPVVGGDNLAVPGHLMG